MVTAILYISTPYFRLSIIATVKIHFTNIVLLSRTSGLNRTGYLNPVDSRLTKAKHGRSRRNTHFLETKISPSVSKTEHLSYLAYGSPTLRYVMHLVAKGYQGTLAYDIVRRHGLR